MNFTVKQLYIIITVVVSLVINFVYINKRNQYVDDWFLKRTINDEQHWVFYFLDIVTCILLIFLYPDNISEITDVFFHYTFLAALAQHSFITKDIKRMGKEGYEKVVSVADYMFTYAWIISAFRELFQIKSIMLDMLLLLGIAGLSVLGLKEIKQAKEIYLSQL